VDFPDPFAPIIAKETPEKATNDTPRNTTGPPKDFESSDTNKTGPAEAGPAVIPTNCGRFMS
jgi:hypothetical protein